MKTSKTLLSRDEFKSKVLARDKNKCVNCPSTKNLTVHHIIDRKCFEGEEAGGYYMDNGVSVCEACHWQAEKGELSCEELRRYANIKSVVLPKGFDKNKQYDKFGRLI